MNLIKEEVLENIKNNPTQRVYEGKEDLFSRAILHEGKKEWDGISGNSNGRQDECVYQELYTITQPEADHTEYNISFIIKKTISVPYGCPTLSQFVPALSGNTYSWMGRNYEEQDFVGINFSQREIPEGTFLQISFMDRQRQDRLIWTDETSHAEVRRPELSEVFDNWNARYINPWYGFFNKNGTFLEKWDAQATPISFCAAKTVPAREDLEPINSDFISRIYYGASIPEPSAPITRTWHNECKTRWGHTTTSHHEKVFQQFLQTLRENSR